MLQTGNDERMLKSFRELRADDEVHVPEFGRVWRTARAAARPERPAHGRLVVVLGMVAVAAIASALTLVVTQSPAVPSTTIAAEPPPLTNSAPASATGTLSAETPAAAAAAAEDGGARPTQVSDSPSRKSSKPSRSPRRAKPQQSVPCVEC